MKILSSLLTENKSIKGLCDLLTASVMLNKFHPKQT